jgi:hypothetical protein
MFMLQYAGFGRPYMAAGLGYPYYGGYGYPYGCGYGGYGCGYGYGYGGGYFGRPYY